LQITWLLSCTSMFSKIMVSSMDKLDVIILRISRKSWKLFNGISTDWFIAWLTAWLTARCLQHNSTMAKTTGLIFFLFDVTSAWDAIPLYIQCILHGLTSALLCVPFIFAQCRFCGKHLMAFICNENHP